MAGLASKGGLRTGKAQSGVDGQAWTVMVRIGKARRGLEGALRYGRHGPGWLGVAQCGSARPGKAGLAWSVVDGNVSQD